MAIYRRADDIEPSFRILTGAREGGPLWIGEQSVPRAAFLVWRSPSRIWHAYAYNGRQEFTHVAGGRTRSEAFYNARRAAS